MPSSNIGITPDWRQKMGNEIDPQKDTYDSRVRCGNCGHEERVEIPKGQHVADTACNRCGCPTVRRVSWSIP